MRQALQKSAACQEPPDQLRDQRHGSRPAIARHGRVGAGADGRWYVANHHLDHAIVRPVNSRPIFYKYGHVGLEDSNSKVLVVVESAARTTG